MCILTLFVNICPVCFGVRFFLPVVLHHLLHLLFWGIVSSPLCIDGNCIWYYIPQWTLLSLGVPLLNVSY